MFFSRIIDLFQNTQQKKNDDLQVKMSSQTQSIYYHLCRDEEPVEIDNKSFFCDYANNNDPRLILAPFRRETLHLDPLIVVYYDVIHDKEITFMKDEASSRVF